MEKKDSRIKEYPKGKMPVVFMFQPIQYQIVTGEKLREWENDLRERVGLTKLKTGAMEVESGTYSICTPEGPFYDDCDMDDEIFE